jgi:lysophospholipase L1-like esterase
MFVINEDNSIYVTRGDIVAFAVTAEDNGKPYTFKAGDLVRIKIFGKKDAESVILQKDFPVVADTESVDIYLTKEDTKLGDVISKPKDYWYEVELNPLTDPQTIIGYDEDGAKVFKLFPEGDDIEEYEPTEEDIPFVDNELDMSSTRPVENQAIARAIVGLSAEFEETKAEVDKRANATDQKADETAAKLSVEKARIDALVGHKNITVNQPLEYLDYISAETKAKVDGTIDTDGVFATVHINHREANLFVGGSGMAVFTLPIECRPIDLGIIHTAYGMEYSIDYDNASNTYRLVMTAQETSAPTEAGSVNITYALDNHELKDIRVDSEGFVHETAGNAMRHQAEFEYTKILFNENIGWYINGFNSWKYNEELNFCMSDAIPVTDMDGSLYVYIHEVNPYVANVAFTVANSHSDSDIVETHIFTDVGWHKVTVPNDANFVFLSKCVNIDNEIIGLPFLAQSRSEFSRMARDRLSKLGVIAEKAKNHTVFEFPEKYELVVGDTFELFWKGVIHSTMPENYYVKVKCGKGTPYKRKFVYTPTAADVGTYTLTAELYSEGHALIDTANVDLVVKNKANNPAQEKVVLYVGDSLAMGGCVPDEFHRRLTDIGGAPKGDGLNNICFIGNKTSDKNHVPYVGEGGWTFNSYNTSMQSNDFMWVMCSHDKTEIEDQHSIYSDNNGTKWKLETIEEKRIKVIRVSGNGTLPASGKLAWVSGGVNKGTITYTATAQAAGNPFWNETAGKVDFTAFVESQGKTNLDFVYVLLGWNSVSDTEETYKARARQFINNVLLSYPNCKIVLLGLQIPSRDGLATNYGANTSPYSWYDVLLDYVFNLNKWYQELANEYANVSFVNVAGQFDTENNMQAVNMSANTRNNTMELVQSNGVHPALSGYYQIADVCYRNLTHQL